MMVDCAILGKPMKLVDDAIFRERPMVEEGDR